MRGVLVAGAAVLASLVVPAIARADGSASVNGVVSVTDQMSVRATNIATAEGSVISGPIATFTDRTTTRTASAFSAEVSWGDGVTTTGTVQGQTGRFSVRASHTYAEEGAYTITVHVVQTTSGTTATGSGRATIADARLTATGTSFTSGRSVDAVVATFIDSDPGQTISDYTAVISWGDGSPAAAGTITGAGGGGFEVQGTHTYRRAGTFTVTVSIRDAGGAHASASTTAKIH